MHNSWQSGAALIVNGKVVGAVSEERFNRIKNFHGMPTQSIEFLLSVQKLKITDVDKVVYGMVTSVEPDESVQKKINRIIIEGCIKNTSVKEKYFERLTTEMVWNKKHLDEIEDWICKNKLKEKFYLIDHHYSHAAGAYYSSPFNNCLTFTSDGKGNYKSAGIYRGTKSVLEELDYLTTFDSLGYFYGNITIALGFKAERHEGKVTGLAAYGKKTNFQKVVDSIFELKNGSFKSSLGKYYLPWFCKKSDLPYLFDEVKKYKKEDVAYATQNTLENVVCYWIESAIKKYNSNKLTNICLSGGVFANVRLNQKIMELDKVKNIFVMPAMGDMGIPLGSCFAQMAKDKKTFKSFIPSMSLGPSFSDKYIEKMLKKNKRSFTRIKDKKSIMLKCLSENKVIGFFNGKMEYGPRALCNRSIVYHCRDITINSWLNKRLNRSEFMPFAPVTTIELAKECFINWSENHYSADFMTVTYSVTEKFQKTCPAVVHIDGTARPQIVRKENNPILHSIITQYHRESGELALINTSFNNHEEPIVCTPDDALQSLSRGNVDVLLIENFLIQ